MRKHKMSFAALLVVAATMCSSIAFAQGPQARMISGEDHRRTVSSFVQELQGVADRGNGVFGEQIREMARIQNESKNGVAEALDKIRSRNKVKTFLIGTDYRNVGQLRSEMVKTMARVDQLKRMIDSATGSANQAVLQEQVQVMEQERQGIEDFVKDNEGKFSLFGWFVRLFSL